VPHERERVAADPGRHRLGHAQHRSRGDRRVRGMPPRSITRSAARVASGWLVAAIASRAIAGGRPNAKRNAIDNQT